MSNLKSREELIDLVSQFSALIQSSSEKEVDDAMFETLHNGILDPEWSDYIFHSDKFVTRTVGLK